MMTDKSSSPDIVEVLRAWRNKMPANWYGNVRIDTAISEILGLRASLQPATPTAGEPIRPLPGELALIQVALESLRHISGYSPASTIQPVQIARDALKKIAELKFESAPVANLAADQT